MPVEERALIFERFARGVTAGRRTGSEGAGLGLALVDEHVRMHGGRVWVEDRLDGEPGARFVIELNAVGGRRRRRGALAVSAGGASPVLRSAMLLAVLAGCAIQPNSGPRDIPGGPAAPARPAAATPPARRPGSSRVFLVATDGGRAARCARSCATPPAASRVIEALLDGPNTDEIAAGLDTELPAGLDAERRAPVRAARSPSTCPTRSWTLTSSELRLAVAQIVFTASELDGRAGGAAPRRRRAAGVAGRPRRAAHDAADVYDYPGLAESRASRRYPPIPPPSTT